MLRECSFITGGGDGSKSGMTTKIFEGREGGVRKKLQLIRGIYENDIDEARGGSTKIKLMEPDRTVFHKLGLLKFTAKGGGCKKNFLIFSDFDPSPPPPILNEHSLIKLGLLGGFFSVCGMDQTIYGIIL